jgi:tetratricopeptide (TPR) repeat protein
MAFSMIIHAPLLVGVLGGCQGDATSPARPAAPSDPVARLTAELERRPQDVELRLRLAQALQDAGRHEASIAQLRQAVALRPDAGILHQLAMAYSAAGRLQEAEATYQQLLQHAPGNAQVLHNMGTLALDRGNAEGAISYYRRAIVARPDYLIAYSNLGSVYKFHGRYQEAAVAYQQAFDLPAASPTEEMARADALYQLADLDLLRGDAAGAEARLARFVELIPDHPKAHYTRAQALLKLGRVDAAQRELDIHMRILDQSQPDGPVATAR